MVATLYVLFAIASSNSPSLIALASYEDKASCQTAAAAVSAALKDGQDPEQLACISTESLNALGKANGLK